MTQRGEAVGLLQHNLLSQEHNLHLLSTLEGSGISEESSIITKFKGKLEIEDIKTVKGEDNGRYCCFSFY
jgi:DNA-directed RNA polymerase subunit beta'